MNYYLDPTLIIILIFGIVTSYTDMKYGKIKNIAILLLIMSGILINIFYTKTLVNPQLETYSYFTQTISNILISFALGYFLWFGGLWSSGDAKLFLGYSILLPISIYRYDYILFFPSLVILINTFLPVAIFLLVTALIRMDYRWLANDIRRNFRILNLVKITLFIFGFSYLIQIILNYLNVQASFLLQIILLFIAIEVLEKISDTAMIVASILGSLLRIFLAFSSLLSITFFLDLILTLASLMALIFLVNPIIEFSFGKYVHIKDLESGMVLGEQLVKKRGKYIKKQSSILTIFDIFKRVGEEISNKSIRKLNEEGVKELKELYRQKKLDFDHVKIVNTVPFAPFMFFGVLLTYLIQGSLLAFI